MKQYFAILKTYFNLIKQMKEYSNKIDKLVIRISLACLIWIFFYKLWFINEDIFFKIFKSTKLVGNITYSIGDIINTVSSSIVASSIFYFVTIFIPRYYKIKRMKVQLKPQLFHMSDINDGLISKLKNGKTGQNYVEADFLETDSIKNLCLKNDFSVYYMNTYNFINFDKAINHQCNFISNILFNYSDLLANNLFIDLSNFYNTTFRDLKIIQSEENDLRSTQYFIAFVSILNFTNELKNYYYPNNETIQ